eukprot:Gb_31088 [translate_table: standard]
MFVRNAVIDDYYDSLGTVRYWWTHSMISDEIYQAILDNCNFTQEDDSPSCDHYVDYAMNNAFGNIDQIPLNVLHNHQMALLYSLEGLQDVIMEEAKTFTTNHLQNDLAKNNAFDKWVAKKDLPGEVEYALKYMWHRSMPRLEARSDIEQFGSNDVSLGMTMYKMLYVSNEKYLELAKLDLNIVQALHQKRRLNTLSGGVLGTAEILFQSKKRGLGLSERLGMGFSCNGNNVAYVAGSSAPLKTYGLKKEDFVNIAKTDRPGPTISMLYTSSLGFTIQSGVLLKAYPYMLFKGIGSYGWPQGDGKITLDDGTDRIQFSPPKDSLLPRKIKAFQKLAKHLGGVLFMSRVDMLLLNVVAVGNAVTDDYYDSLGTLRYWWTHSMIFDETYWAILDNCDFTQEDDSPSCDHYVNYAMNNEFGNIDQYSIYTPSCTQ